MYAAVLTIGRALNNKGAGHLALNLHHHLTRLGLSTRGGERLALKHYRVSCPVHGRSLKV
jgi:hypothetical protein